MLIPIAEYADTHGISRKAVQMKCRRGGYKSAVKIGRDWVIDSEEPYKDLRFSENNIE